MGSTFRLELKRSGHGPAYILEAGRAFRERRSDKGLLPRFGKDLRCQGRSMRAGFRICELCLGELVVSFIDHAWMRFSLGYNRAKARCHTLSPMASATRSRRVLLVHRDSKHQRLSFLSRNVSFVLFNTWELKSHLTSFWDKLAGNPNTCAFRKTPCSPPPRAF